MLRLTREKRQLLPAPRHIEVQHMVAARPAVARITAVRRLSGDNDQIAGTQQIFLPVATARFPFDNRPHGELRMAVPFIGLAALPGAAQLQPGQLFVAPEGLWISRVWFTKDSLAEGIGVYSMPAEACRGAFCERAGKNVVAYRRIKISSVAARKEISGGVCAELAAVESF
jgi:hypothetical protein